MNLLLDIGNSRFKWVLVSQADDWQTQGVELVSQKNFERFCTEILDKAAVTDIWIANVNSYSYLDLITEWNHRRNTAKIHVIVTPPSFEGLTISYLNPALLGVDRFLAMIAARQLTAKHFCTIDCGTAITLDLVDCSGQHQGGHIIPGLSLFTKLLSTHTVGCRSIMQEHHYHLQLATNTQDAIANGAFNAAIAYLNHMLITLGARYSHEITYFLTGGDAPLFLPHLHNQIQHEPELVLRGLHYYSNSS